ncbi:hypothetical protein [Spirosoma aerolatum]|uniref:hypothetical protein n=1 Tax=Spirosoma aerolatum TaxID=1211326 RepID=UPI0009AE938C|nr:hypothetical protein [Spirosoma aerolatum]
MTKQQIDFQITKNNISALSDGQLKALQELCEAIMVDSDEQAVKSMEAINVLVGDRGDEMMGMFIYMFLQDELKR